MMTKIVWRDWFSDPAIAQLTAMGTLPRNEVEIDTRLEDGASVAKLIAEDAYSHDAESFRNGGEIVIVEPEEFAGTYCITVDYEPIFSAYSQD